MCGITPPPAMVACDKTHGRHVKCSQRTMLQRTGTMQNAWLGVHNVAAMETWEVITARKRHGDAP